MNQTNETIRVLIADDQQLVRAGLAALLDLEDDIDVVAQLDDGTHLVDTVAEKWVDVALVDIEMPQVDGITAAQQLSDAGTGAAVLIVTTFGRAGYLQRALSAGARGFMVKDSPAEQLAQAIRTVHAGGQAVDPVLAAEALTTGANPLTEREQQVLKAASTGVSVRSIAAELYLSPGTVRNHLSAMIGKTGTSNRAEAVRVGLSNGWI